MTVPFVAIEKVSGGYPFDPPFHPGRSYPEYRGPVAERPNAVFDSVRQMLKQLRFDEANFGTKQWNPLGHLVKPGQTVFIKPNMVDHAHRFGAELWSVVTHPSVVRAVAEYVAIALEGKGRILIGDNPHVDCQWDKLEQLYRPDLLQAYFQATFGIAIEMLDLRDWHVPNLQHYGFKRGRVPLRGDPKGTVTVDVGAQSLLNGLPWWLFRGTYNERLDTVLAHLNNHHRYEFSRSIFDADVFISVPKLKSHAKVGATLNVKGLIGTIVNKNALVHWRLGFPALGGDEYPEPNNKRDYLKLYFQHVLRSTTPSYLYFHLRRLLVDTPLGVAYRNAVTCEAQDLRMLRGAWEGNDTTWRMTVDCYNAFVTNPAHGGSRVNFFSVIDGVVGGDTDGPHFPDPRECGVVIAGEDLLAVDFVAVRLMDFRLQTVRYLAHLAAARGLNQDEISLASSSYALEGFFEQSRRHLEFKPPHRWPNLSLHGLSPGRSYLPQP